MNYFDTRSCSRNKHSKNHLFYRVFDPFHSATSQSLLCLWYDFAPDRRQKCHPHTIIASKLLPVNQKLQEYTKVLFFPWFMPFFAPKSPKITALIWRGSVLLNLVKYQISSCLTATGKSLCLSRYIAEHTGDFFSGPMYKNWCPLVLGAIPMTCTPFLSIDSILYLPRSVR